APANHRFRRPGRPRPDRRRRLRRRRGGGRLLRGRHRDRHHRGDADDARRDGAGRGRARGRRDLDEPRGAAEDPRAVRRAARGAAGQRRRRGRRPGREGGRHGAGPLRRRVLRVGRGVRRVLERRQADLRLPARSSDGHPGLGPGPGGHEGRRPARAHHPAGPRLRVRGHGPDPRRGHARLRRGPRGHRL
ncbi:MAG: hypothetical protein AVDCRST_MAG13-1927, partial [uncultured Solirubrobacteraceae bacterium]